MTTKVFISVEGFTKEDLYTHIDNNPSDEIIIWGPENMYIPQLFKTFPEWKVFEQDMIDRNVNFKIVIGCSEFYGENENVIAWDDFAVYELFKGYLLGNAPISSSKKDFYSYNFVTRNGRESFQSSLIVDLLYKYNLNDKTLIEYSNYGDEFHNKHIVDVDGKETNWEPSHWNGNMLTSDEYRIPNLNAFNIPYVGYDFSMVDILVAKNIQFPQLDKSILYPMLLDKPFIIYGAKGIYEKMKNLLGIDIHDELVSMYPFDNISDHIHRAERVVQNIKHLDQNDRMSENKKLFGSYNKIRLVELVKKKDVHPVIVDLLTNHDELIDYKRCYYAGDAITVIGKNIY